MGSHPTFQDRIRAIKKELGDRVIKIERISAENEKKESDENDTKKEINTVEERENDPTPLLPPVVSPVLNYTKKDSIEMASTH